MEEVTADYIIRDHNRQLFEQKKELFLSCADFLNRKYGEGTAIVDMKDSYYNMREIMQQHIARLMCKLYKPDLLIEMPAERFGIFEFYRAREIVEAGRMATRAALERSLVEAG